MVNTVECYFLPIVKLDRIPHGVSELYVGRKVVLVLEGEREGREGSRLKFWSCPRVYGPGKSNVLSTDMDLDISPGFPGTCWSTSS